MPTTRFTDLVGIPERTYRRWQAKQRVGKPPQGPWPTPAQDSIDQQVVAMANRWPAWGHRKITALLNADQVACCEATVKRVMARHKLLLPVGYTQERRELAKARKAAFTDPPTRPNEVWQLDFSEYETRTGGTWRIAGCADYVSKYEFGWHLATTCNRFDAIEAVQRAVEETERLHGRPMIEVLADPDTGEVSKIILVTDNGSAFKSAAFAKYLASTGWFTHVRTRRATPGQNGVRERAFGSLKYEHLYRYEIDTGPDVARLAEEYRQIYNWIRPHESLQMRRPGHVHCNTEPQTANLEIPTQKEPKNLPNS